ncbi:MAG: hypothetical protein ABIH82_06280 [Candidatus Woesearchaeota archaeon]|nr:hypothetical protein [Nanoarchaeota archaeon]MBU1973794.1 hypothetical protein [Nanoarchaeota archaeon]
MSLEDEIGRRKFLKTAGGLLVMAGTGKLLSACSEPLHYTNDPNDGNGNEFLLYDDFREDSGLWELEQSRTNPVLNYTPNGLEISDNWILSYDSFVLRNGMSLEARWRMSDNYEGELSVMGSIGFIDTPFYLNNGGYGTNFKNWHVSRLDIQEGQNIAYVDGQQVHSYDENLTGETVRIRITGGYPPGHMLIDYIKLTE